MPDELAIWLNGIRVAIIDQTHDAGSRLILGTEGEPDVEHHRECDKSGD